MSTFVYASLILPLTGLFLYWISRSFVNNKVLMTLPGPKPHPFVGHIFQVPLTQTWRYFEKIARIHGPIFRVSLGGDNVVVLSDSRDAEELLTRRSKNYSSRGPSIYLGKYWSNNKRILLLPYGERSKRQRTAFHKMLQPKVIGSYDAIQESESLRLLHSVIFDPQGFFDYTHHFSASLIFTLNYGKPLTGTDLETEMEILQDFTHDALPGAHLVDIFPWLDRLPDILAPWRKEALRKHERDMQLYGRLASEVKAKVDAGDDNLECFVARLWSDQRSFLDEEEIAYIAAAAFEAGTETTASTLQWFLMAMILYPHIMHEARNEIDRVVGADGRTIPGYEHINALPYCAAITKETLRWQPAAPVGFPHYSDADDEYKGFKIDGNSIVIPCIWNMHHNEAEFPDPYTFNPGRFMRQEEIDNQRDSFTEGHYAFGFGRRICPGQHLAGKSVWIVIVRLLWAFDIQPGLDADGRPIRVDPNDCTSGITSKPVEFPMRITPRSTTHVETITKQSAPFERAHFSEKTSSHS